MMKVFSVFVITFLAIFLIRTSSNSTVCDSCAECNGYGDISIPPNVSEIAPSAFKECHSLYSVTIPT